ncbi:Rho Gtpase-Activating Protein 36 [Manis pentadactyla]|nr:Rho Gtpase-Activating Protein 36 [Manis pentadactyla]
MPESALVWISCAPAPGNGPDPGRGLTRLHAGQEDERPQLGALCHQRWVLRAAIQAGRPDGDPSLGPRHTGSSGRLCRL